VRRHCPTRQPDQSRRRTCIGRFDQTIETTLKAGDSITLVGFGTFEVKERAERQGRNPQSGAAITIAAAKVPSFKAGKNLKDTVNA